jgi:hypothetical protein
MTDENGAPVDISTGYSFIMTLNSEANPEDVTNQLYALTGSIVSGPAGSVAFTPSSVQADLIGSFYYDIQVTYPSGAKRTVEKGKYVYKQDITKA